MGVCACVCVCVRVWWGVVCLRMLMLCMMLCMVSCSLPILDIVC